MNRQNVTQDASKQAKAMRHDWNVMIFTGFVPQHANINSLSLIRILIKVFYCSGRITRES